MINRKAKVELPLIYLRTKEDNIMQYGVDILIPARKRPTIKDIQEELMQKLRSAPNLYNNRRVTELLYRFFDEYIDIVDPEDRKEIYISCYSIADELIEKYPRYEKTIESACKKYRVRDLSSANSYYDDRVLKYLFDQLELTKHERYIIDWAEENIPGITFKTLAALINENSFLALNYFLPISTYITKPEKQRLYKFRRIILEKMHVYTELQYNYKHHKSPKLIYSDESRDFLKNIFKKVWIFPDIQNMTKLIHEISSKIKNLKTQFLDNYIYIQQLLHHKKLANNYSDIIDNATLIKNIKSTMLLPSMSELLSLQKTYRTIEMWLGKYKRRMIDILFYS